MQRLRRAGALQHCGSCGAEDRLHDRGLCAHCTLARRLEVLLGDATGGAAPGLVLLRTALGAAEEPGSAIRWLAKPPVARTLAGIASGTLPLTHEALDELGRSQVLDHLRQVLVAAGALPGRDENLARLEAWVAERLAGVADPRDRHLVEAYATWRVLRRQRRRAAGGEAASTAWARRAVAATIDLLAWLRRRGGSLGACTQADVELWLAAGPPARRHARDFLRWAAERRLSARLDVAQRPSPAPTRSAGVEDQRRLARRLLTDDAVPAPAPAAGLLVVLYAQNVSKVARLTSDAVTEAGGAVLVRLGTDDLCLPAPLGALVAGLAAEGRARAGGRPPGSPTWLFPGGLPGRPLSGDQLQARLGTLGLRARPARTGALLDLAAEVPPVVLAELLGITPGTAARWVRAAAGEWAGYAAARAGLRRLAGSAPRDGGSAAAAGTGAPGWAAPGPGVLVAVPGWPQGGEATTMRPDG